MHGDIDRHVICVETFDNGGLWLVLSHSSCLFSHWSVAVGGLWLMRFHSSCLFHTGRSLLGDFGLCAPTRLVFFDIGQSLLANFGMCSPTRLIFLTLVSFCWWTLTCALSLVLSFSHWPVTVVGLWLVRSHSSIVMKVCKLEVCFTAHTCFESLCYESLQVESLLHPTHTHVLKVCVMKICKLEVCDVKSSRFESLCYESL